MARVIEEEHCSVREEGSDESEPGEPELPPPFPPPAPPPVEPPPALPPAVHDAILDAAGVGDPVADLEAVLRYGSWGVFRFTPKQPGGQGGLFGGYQASCPFHRKNISTGCKRFLRCPSGDAHDRRIVLRQLMWWCSQAQDFDRQRKHLVQTLPLDEVPSYAHLSALKVTERPPPGSIKTDVELDARECEALEAAAAAAAAAAAVAADAPSDSVVGGLGLLSRVELKGIGVQMGSSTSPLPGCHFSSMSTSCMSPRNVPVPDTCM